MSKELHNVESLFERQEIVSNVAGFFAPTHRELSEALTLIGIRDTVGVAQHIDEIYRRQQHNRVFKPENAVRAVTKEYIANFRSSGSITRQLGSLAIDISEIFNPNIMIGEEVNNLKTGHRAFVRFVDLKEAYRSSDNNEEQKFVLECKYFAKDDTVDAYVTSRLGQIRVKDARNLISESIEDQKNREAFWLETVKLLRFHRIAGPIINASLSVK